MCAVTHWASVDLARLTVAFLFLLLLLAGLPLPGIRRWVLAVSGILFRVTVIVAVIALGIWAMLPATEPAAFSTAVQSLVERAAQTVGCEPHLVRPFLYWWIAANLAVAGILLLSIITFATRLGILHHHLSKLFPPPATTRPSPLAPPRPRKRLSDLL